MNCNLVALPGGGAAIVCRETPRARTCSVCKRKTREYRLCDYPAGGKKTCDAVLCVACADHRGRDVDYCPLHAAAVDGRLKL